MMTNLKGSSIIAFDIWSRVLYAELFRPCYDRGYYMRNSSGPVVIEGIICGAVYGSILRYYMRWHHHRHHHHRHYRHHHEDHSISLYLVDLSRQHEYYSSTIIIKSQALGLHGTKLASDDLYIYITIFKTIIQVVPQDLT